VSERVAERIRRRIRADGPIAFDDYMREALYGPGGFYERPPVGSESGHFVTSPHVHPIFSGLFGSAVEDLWNRIGRPRPLRLVEAGAGDGTMGRELVDGFGRAGIDLEYTAVDVSAGAREVLASIADVVVDRLSDVEALDPGVVVANELLDNLPFRRVRGVDGGTLEVRIDLAGDRLVEVPAPCPDELAALVPAPAEGAEAVVPTGALGFIEELAACLREGYALLVDYGTATGPAGEVHGYRGHRIVEDVVSDPGSADITAGVDLGVVVAHATKFGLTAFGPVHQASALTALGFDEWSRAERSRQAALLDAGRGSEATRVWDGRNRARLLVDEATLGRLQWLVLATPGLLEPDWLAHAREFETNAR
jgi:SAM-dependent MidA family methyltransferase